MEWLFAAVGFCAGCILTFTACCWADPNEHPERGGTVRIELPPGISPEQVNDLDRRLSQIERMADIRSAQALSTAQRLKAIEELLAGCAVRA